MLANIFSEPKKNQVKEKRKVPEKMYFLLRGKRQTFPPFIYNLLTYSSLFILTKL